jgi:hypothetical protein
LPLVPTAAIYGTLLGKELTTGMTGSQLYLLISVLLLALLLFFPVSKIIWMMSCRRLHRKLNRELTGDEMQGQKQRARIIATLLVLVFSYFFNSSLLDTLYG